MSSAYAQAVEILEAKYGLPREVVFCKRCVISNQRPSSTVEFKNRASRPKDTIAFGEDGICAACKYQEIKETAIDWDARHEQLAALCNEHRSRAGNYDCIVPGSGGKDSTFTALILKERYGMHPLTVTWAPHVYTDIGWSNFQKWIHAGLDNILFTPNGRVHRTLTRLAFENLLHPFQPFIVGQRHVGPKTSVRFGIPLIFYGENPAEYGNNIDENYIPTMNPKFYVGSQAIEEISLGGVPGDQLIADHGLSHTDLIPYTPVDPDAAARVGTTVHYLGYYIKWDPQECYYYSVAHTGFSPNTERTQGSYSKYSSIDDRIDPLHYYTTFVKFGLGRASYDAAQEIRNGKIARDEGVALVKRYDDEFPSKYFAEMLEYMGISAERFHECVDAGRSPHLWQKRDGHWHLRRAVWMD